MAKKKRRYYYPPKPKLPAPLTPDQRERSRETMEKVLHALKATPTEEVPVKTEPQLLYRATGLLVIGSEGLTHDEWREMADTQPDRYVIDPPLPENTDI